MISNKANIFNDANFPKTTDGSNLSQFLIDNYYSEEEFSSIFEDLKEGNIPEIESNNRSLILSETLPINFLNHLTLEKSDFEINLFFTPSQRFVMKYVQKTLFEMRNKESYHLLLNYFANKMTQQYSTYLKLFKFCGEVTIKKSKQIGIYTKDNQIEIYSKNSLQNHQKTFSPEKITHQSKEWECAISELESGIFSPLITVFRSFDSLSGIKTLPFDAYSGFIDYITSPDLIVTSQLLSQNIDDIDIPLMKIFMYKNLHRRLLKHCIYEDVFSTDDTSLLMRRNSKEARIIIDFLTNEIQPLISSSLNSIKKQICETIEFDYTQTDPQTFNCVKESTKMFITSFIQILPIIPSSIRFVCCLINATCDMKFKNNGHKGVFMAFFFRVIFPIICQPRQSDPLGLVVDIKKMAAFGRVLTYIFVGEEKGASLAHFAEIQRDCRAGVEAIFDALVNCEEKFDIVECPSFRTACEMVDVIREKCAKRTAGLIFDRQRPSLVFVKWLDSLVED